MSKTITMRIGVKREAGEGPVTRGGEPGPIKRGEVEGQSLWLIVQCPWCGGVNRVEESVTPGLTACAWCGSLFS